MMGVCATTVYFLPVKFISLPYLVCSVVMFFFFSSRRRHTRSVSAFLLNRSSDLMENTNLSKQQQVSEIMRQMLTQAQTAGQYFTNDQIKEMTRKVSAEVDLVHQQTQNQRYGSSHIGATAKDISNVVT